MLGDVELVVHQLGVRKLLRSKVDPYLGTRGTNGVLISEILQSKYGYVPRTYADWQDLSQAALRSGYQSRIVSIADTARDLAPGTTAWRKTLRFGYEDD